MSATRAVIPTCRADHGWCTRAFYCLLDQRANCVARCPREQRPLFRPVTNRSSKDQPATPSLLLCRLTLLWNVNEEIVSKDTRSRNWVFNFKSWQSNYCRNTYNFLIESPNDRKLEKATWQNVTSFSILFLPHYAIVISVLTSTERKYARISDMRENSIPQRIPSHCYFHLAPRHTSAHRRIYRFKQKDLCE